MKYTHPEISTCFDFENGSMNTLVVENPAFLRKLLSDFHAQLQGEAGEGVVSVSNACVDMPHYVEVLDSFVPFEINRKSLLSKMVTALEKEAVRPEHYEQTMCMMRDIEVYLEKIAFDFPCDITFPKISVNALLKGVGLQLRDEYPNLCEKVLDYFELVCEFDRPKLFVLVNFRSYIDDEEFALFAQSVMSHGYQVLMIEGFAKKKIPQENRLIIDGDLCEIG